MIRACWIAFLLGFGALLQGKAQPALIIETVRVETQGTVHRVSLAMPSGASVQSIFSDGANPLLVTAEMGLYQSDGQALLSSNADAVLTDSWFTIGLPAGLNEVQSTGGSGWDAAVESFENGLGFSSTDPFGGAFYVLPLSPQGVENEGEVLLGQFVSTGPIDVTFNVQWKPDPSQPSEYTTGLTATLLPSGYGCTDEAALNHDPEALWDDGSCIWSSASFAGLTYELHQPETDALPPTYRIYANFDNPNEGLVSWFGTAENPLSLETTTDFYQVPEGSAGYPVSGGEPLQRDSWVTVGTDANGILVGLSESDFEAGGSLQSDSEFGGAIAVFPGSESGIAGISGKVLMAQVTTAGTVQLTTNLSVLVEGQGAQEITGAGLTISGQTPGCMDAEACNYDPTATTEDGSCLTVDALGVCGGGCSSDEDVDGVCDDAEVLGCTDSAADNFDAAATEDDGSCTTEEPNEPDTTSSGFLGLVQQEVGSGPGGSAIHRVYAQFDTSGYEVISIFGTEDHPWTVASTTGFYQSPDGGPLASNLPAVSTATSPFDSWFTIGGDQSESVSLLSVGLDFTTFEAGGNFEESDPEGGAIFIIPGSEDVAVSGSDGKVLIAQFTSTGSMDFLVNLKFINPSGGNPEVMGLALTIPPSVGGCNDPVACNFNPAATASDESCTYAESGYDCSGACLGDADNDGVCDANEYSGCSNVNACNYDPLVDAMNGLAEACLYPEDLYGAAYFDCLGACINDTDGDGVCDEDEQDGCTYSSACNFDPLASEEDGSCVFAEPWKDCAGECWFDFNGDGICDQPGSGGCTYPEAYNYDLAAAYDDGTCEFPSGDCRFDSNGDGGVNISDLLDMLVALGTTCP